MGPTPKTFGGPKRFGQRLAVVTIISRTWQDVVKLKSWFWVGRNSSPTFSPFVDWSSSRLVCMYRSVYRLQCHFSISTDDILVAFRKYSRTSHKFVRNLADILTFWPDVGHQMFLGPQLSFTLFIMQLLPVLFPSWKAVHMCVIYKWLVVTCMPFVVCCRQSRVVRNSAPMFIWGIRRDCIEPRLLLKEQIINHYGHASFTTKVGCTANEDL